MPRPLKPGEQVFPLQAQEVTGPQVGEKVQVPGIGEVILDPNLSPKDRTELNKLFTRAGVEEEQAAQRQAVGEFVKRAPIPAVTTAAGTALGGMVGMPTLGAMAGSTAGTFINQKLGLEPESKTNLAISATVPGVVGGMGAAVRGIGRSMTTTRALRKAGMVGEAEELPGRLRPSAGAVNAAFEEVSRRGGARILKLPATTKVVEDLTSKVNVGFRGGLGSVKSRLNELLDVVTRPGGVSVQEIKIKTEQLGEMVRTLERRGGLGLGAAKQMRKALLEDFDSAATTASKEAAVFLKTARDLAKKSFAADELEDLIFGERKRIAGLAKEFFDIDGNRVLQKLENLTNPKSPKFDKNFTSGLKSELPEIKALFERLDQFGPIKMEIGAGSLIIRSAMGTAGGAAAGGLLGGLPGAGTMGFVGAVAGAKGPEIADRIVAKALLNPAGRAVFERTLRLTDNRITAPLVQALASLLRVSEQAGTTEITNNLLGGGGQ